MDGGAWHGTGETQTVSVGSHTVEFSDVAGWAKPGNRVVTINHGQTASITGTYTTQIGSLQVTIIRSRRLMRGRSGMWTEGFGASPKRGFR